MQILNVESGKVIAKLEKDIDDIKDIVLKKTTQIVSEKNVYIFTRNNASLQGN